MMRQIRLGILTVFLLPGGAAAAPTLTPGAWTFVGPAVPPSTFGNSGITVDPSNPDVLYVTVDTQGLWKSTDRGSTWNRMGDPSSAGFPTTGYLDVPIRVAVDPSNSQRMYATDGVRGSTMGFWVSTDGGQTWTVPQGFRNLGVPRDVTTMAVNPADFNHVLVGSHSPWPGHSNAGILESKDGGNTWTAHPPVASWPVGSMGINFLYNPAVTDPAVRGSSATWLVGTDGNGLWRTDNAGATWAQVTTVNTAHGGQQIYITRSGTVLAGAMGHPLRSLDNGRTWQETSGTSYSYYMGIVGDGSAIYTLFSYPSQGPIGNSPFYVTPEDGDGLTWSSYQGGAQTFSNGPASMTYDAVNGIVYAAMWTNGLWALKVLGSPVRDGVPPARPAGLRVR